MPKKHNLPAELRKPMRLDHLLAETSKRRRAGLNQQIIGTELRRRVTLLAQYLGRRWPENESEWLELVIAICSHFEVVPAFKFVVTGAGRRKNWSIWKNIELLVDVLILKHKKKKLTDHSACKYIAEHPKDYDNRYPKSLKTLHRQFLRARKETDLPDPGLDPATILYPEQERDFLDTRRRILEKVVADKSILEMVRKEIAHKSMLEMLRKKVPTQ